MSDEQKAQEENPEKTEEKPKERIQVRDITPEGASKVKDLKFTKTFRMTVELDDGAIVEGDFTCKRLTVAETARIGIVKAQLALDTPPQALDLATKQLHEWMALCQVALTAKPDWFNMDEMFDTGPLARAYEEVRAFNNSFRKAVGK